MYYDILPLKSEYHFLKVKEATREEMNTALGAFCTVKDVSGLWKNSIASRGFVNERYTREITRGDDCPLEDTFIIQWHCTYDKDSPTGEMYEYYYFNPDDNNVLYHRVDCFRH